MCYIVKYILQLVFAITWTEEADRVSQKVLVVHAVVRRK